VSEDQVGALVLGAVACAVGPFVHWLTERAATGRLRRNYWAGLRTSRTLASDEAWVDGHRAALPWTRRTAGATVLLGAMTLCLAVPAPDAALVTGLAAVALVVAGALLSVRGAHRALG
jgi:hypothetical protein